MSKSEQAERALNFFQCLKKKYGMDPIIAFLTGKMSFNDEIAYAIAVETCPDFAC